MAPAGLEPQRPGGFAAFKPTTRGTVATLCDTRIYDINEVAGDQQETNARPTADQQAATNKKEKKEKKDPADSDERRLSQLLLLFRDDCNRQRHERQAVGISRAGTA